MSDKKFSIESASRVIFKYFWVVLLTMIIGIGGAFVLRPGEGQPQLATAQVMVSPDKDFDISNGTLVDLVKTDEVLGEAIREYNKSVKKSSDRLEYNNLFNSLEVAVTGSSRIVTISAKEGDADDPVRLVNIIATKMEKVSSEQLPVYKVKIVSQASLVSTGAGFGLKKAIVIGAVLGLMVGIILAFILNFMRMSKKKDKI